ncbi:MAG: gluconate 2-dehydrogenase subunit 3 family protein [Ginsengibacter sp.]
MKRRRFLSSMAVILPASIVSTEFIFSSCKSEIKEEFFTDENIKLLDEIGETIIPATSTSPGAKAAQIGEFMKVYVTDCYTPDEQNTFWYGINKIKEISSNKYKNQFPKLTLLQKKEILQKFEKDAREFSENRKKNTGANGDAVQTGKGNQDAMNEYSGNFYPMIKELTLFGFFTSKPGATQALRYVQTPGSYKGDVPYKKGDKAWAT